METNSLFKNIFDNFEESVTIFQNGKPVYANDRFLTKFRALILQADVKEL